MGAEKTTTSSQQQTQATPTPQETALNQLYVDRTQAAQPQTLANDQSALSLQGNLMQGLALPGYLNTLPGGIDTNAQNAMAQQAVGVTRAGLNQGGVLDSGTSAVAQARTAGDSYLNSQQFNIQNLMQLMNLATGNAAQNQSAIGSTASQLSNSLAGLRTTNTTGNSTTLGMNPFLKSFSQSAGSAFGNPFSSFQQAGAGYAGFTGGLA